MSPFNSSSTSSTSRMNTWSAKSSRVCASAISYSIHKAFSSWISLFRTSSFRASRSFSRRASSTFPSGKTYSSPGMIPRRVFDHCMIVSLTFFATTSLDWLFSALTGRVLEAQGCGANRRPPAMLWRAASSIASSITLLLSSLTLGMPEGAGMMSAVRSSDKRRGLSKKKLSSFCSFCSTSRGSSCIGVVSLSTIASFLHI
mmetsp:Transcript_17144/g.30786  ORF Transcript_17144/g.30786 Transcript_17144/m.30786 type:complete len:201 (+) Transcript_17144:63-665(+)